MIAFEDFISILIFLGLFIVIAWFMFSVVGLLKRIESRLENLENSMKNKKN